MAGNLQQEKSSAEQLNRQIAGGRYALLLIFLLTIVNLVLLLVDADRYFLFSASLPYYLTLVGMGLDNNFTPLRWDVIGTYTLTALVISAVILLLYLLCLILSTKRLGWLAGALVLFVLDSVALVVFTFALYENPAVNLMDGFLHLWAIVELFQAVRANRKLKQLPPEGAVDISSFSGTLQNMADDSEYIG